MIASVRTNLIRKSVATRSFFNSTTAMPQVSLDEEFPGVPATNPTVASNEVALRNTSSGLKVVSHDNGNQFVTLGAVVGAGSQFENDNNSGLSQLVAKMAFRSTASRSDLRVYREIEQIGGKISTSAGKDYIALNIAVLPEHVDQAAAILAETLTEPRFAKWDVNEQKKRVTAAAESFASSPSNVVISNAHEAAYYDNSPLGRPQFDLEGETSLNENDVAEYFNKYFVSNNIALVGTGIDESSMVDIANTYFSDIPSGPAASTPSVEYVGGESRQRVRIPRTHLALAFNAANADKSEVKVLESLLNNRLSEGVKCLKSASTKASAFSSTYANGGLFGVVGHSNPEESNQWIENAIKELKAVASGVSADELSGAKAQAANGSFVNGHAHFVQLGQAALSNSVKSESAVAQDIANVSADNVAKLAKNLLSTAPTLSSSGNVSSVMRYNALQKLF